MKNVKILALALCLVMSCFAMAGCSGQNEFFEEKSFTPSTQVTGVNVDVRDRKIEVTPSKDKQVHVQYFESSKEYYNISVSDAHVMTMTSASNKEWTDYIGGKPSAESRTIILQLPTSLLNTVALSTTNEDISLPALSVQRSINVSVNNGDIAFKALDVGSAVTLNAKNGDISGEIAGSYNDFAIQSTIKNGDSNLPASKDGGRKSLHVSCNNGDVSIGFAEK